MEKIFPVKELNPATRREIIMRENGLGDQRSYGSMLANIIPTTRGAKIAGELLNSTHPETVEKIAVLLGDLGHRDDYGNAVRTLSKSFGYGKPFTMQELASKFRELVPNIDEEMHLENIKRIFTGEKPAAVKKIIPSPKVVIPKEVPVTPPAVTPTVRVPLEDIPYPKATFLNDTRIKVTPEMYKRTLKVIPKTKSKLNPLFQQNDWIQF